MAPSVITPHVLAIPLPAQGHINPLMRMCKILASNGFIVTFANVEPIHDRMNKAASMSRSTSSDGLDIRRAHIPIAGLDLANDFRFSFQNFFQAVEGLTAALEQLLERLSNEGPPVTCLLSDVFTASPIHKLADKLKLPWVALFPSSQSRNLLCFYVLDGLIPMEDVINASAQPPSDLFHGNLPGLPPLRNLDLPMYAHVVDDTEYIYSIGVRECRLAFERARAIVVNSFDDLEGAAFAAMRSRLNVPLYGVGPLVGELVNESTTSLWPEETHYAEWLHQQPAQSVIYISFGTITVLSRLQFEEVLSGLEASKQRFLWALRPDLVEGFSEFHFSGNYKDCGYFISWAPQLRVLSHPAVAGFITHCGWNSTMEAIANGVPMLCWPYFADQYLNAKFITEEWKIGLRFQAEKSSTGISGGGVVTRCEVERVVRALMEGQEGEIAKKNAANLRDASKRSLQVGGSSHTTLQALVHELGAKP